MTGLAGQFSGGTAVYGGLSFNCLWQVSCLGHSCLWQISCLVGQLLWQVSRLWWATVVGHLSMAGQPSVVGHCGGTPVYGRSAVCGGPLGWDTCLWQVSRLWWATGVGHLSMAGQPSVVGHWGGTPVYGRSAVCGGPLGWDSDITYKHL